MGEKRDMFAGLGWEKEIKSLGDPHIPFNSSSEFEFRHGNAGHDDYELTPFLQSTQAWRWRVQEEQKQYEKKEKIREDVSEKDVDLDEDKSHETEKEVKEGGESSKSLSLRQRMRALPPHHLSLKDRIRDKPISYRDLLRPGPPLSELSKKYAKRK
jgi:hypothetical protein